jgi:hypothetical protein
MLCGLSPLKFSVSAPNDWKTIKRQGKFGGKANHRQWAHSLWEDSNLRLPFTLVTFVAWRRSPHRIFFSSRKRVLSQFWTSILLFSIFSAEHEEIGWPGMWYASHQLIISLMSTLCGVSGYSISCGSISSMELDLARRRSPHSTYIQSMHYSRWPVWVRRFLLPLCYLVKSCLPAQISANGCKIVLFTAGKCSPYI